MSKEIKSKEEILKAAYEANVKATPDTNWMSWEDAVADGSMQVCFDAMEAYHSQFTPSEGVEQAAKEYADRVMPFVWPLNKQGEEIVMRVGQSQPPFSKKHRKEQDKIIAAFLAGASYRPDNQPRN